MTYEVDAVDFFRSDDDELLVDPYAYLKGMRELCPVHREPHHGVVMVTGFQEARQIYNDTDTFSSANSVSGPFPGFPVPLEGDDVSEQIEAYRDQLPMSDQIIVFDPPKHTAHRSLMLRLLTPKRLKENEDLMWALVDRHLDPFVADGSCDFIAAYASPFTLSIISDLLGVPEEDKEGFRRDLAGPGDHTIGSTEGAMTHNPLAALYQRFAAYIEERRSAPRGDVLSGMATATFPDGSIPEVGDVARVAVKPIPSISREQKTVNLVNEEVCIRVGGRHDISAIPRIIPVCEAMVRLTLADYLLRDRAIKERGGI